MYVCKMFSVHTEGTFNNQLLTEINKIINFIKNKNETNRTGMLKSYTNIHGVEKKFHNQGNSN